MTRYYPEILVNNSRYVVNKDGTVIKFRVLDNRCNSYQEAMERLYKYFPRSHSRVVIIED